GGTDGVVECSASSDSQPLHTLGQQVRIAREILRHSGMILETHDEAEITIPAHHLTEKCARRVLLKAEAGQHGTAGVDRHAHTQWQFGLSSKAQDSHRRLVVIPNHNVVRREVTDGFAPVSSYKEHVDFIDLFGQQPLARRYIVETSIGALNAVLRVNRLAHKTKSGDKCQQWPNRRFAI